MLWTIPAFIANQWWDSVLFGRYAILSTFGLAVTTAYFLRNRKKILLAILAYMFIVSFPSLTLLISSIPYIQEANAIQNLPKGNLLIESHFARPQIEGANNGKIFFVSDISQLESLEKLIYSSLVARNRIFISSQALSEPYGVYSGPYLHTLSLSYRYDFTIKSTIEKFTLQKYKDVDIKSNLIIYEIISSSPSAYPQISRLDKNRRRIDYYDLFVKLRGNFIY